MALVALLAVVLALVIIPLKREIERQKKESEKKIEYDKVANGVNGAIVRSRPGCLLASVRRSGCALCVRRTSAWSTYVLDGTVRPPKTCASCARTWCQSCVAQLTFRRSPGSGTDLRTGPFGAAFVDQYKPSFDACSK